MADSEGDLGVVEIWAYRSDVGQPAAESLVGYSVEAVDGDIGTVDEATDEVGACSSVPGV
jgi:hypothetical protein